MTDDVKGNSMEKTNNPVVRHSFSIMSILGREDKKRPKSTSSEKAEDFSDNERDEKKKDQRTDDEEIANPKDTLSSIPHPILGHPVAGKAIPWYPWFQMAGYPHPALESKYTSRKL